MFEEKDGNGALKIAHSTVTGESVFGVIQKNYDIAQITEGYLMRSGYNDIYMFECADKSRWVARLSGVRPRGPANVEYEISMMEHLGANGVSVAEALRSGTGEAGVVLALPDEPRSLVVFQYIEGEKPETLQELELTGKGLATIHAASESYCGPASMY